jgi:hypothetical protein
MISPDDKRLDVARQSIIAADAEFEALRGEAVSKRAMIELDNCMELCDSLLARIGTCRAALANERADKMPSE